MARYSILPVVILHAQEGKKGSGGRRWGTTKQWSDIDDCLKAKTRGRRRQRQRQRLFSIAYSFFFSEVDWGNFDFLETFVDFLQEYLWFFGILWEYICIFMWIVWDFSDIRICLHFPKFINENLFDFCTTIFCTFIHNIPWFSCCTNYRIL